MLLFKKIRPARIRVYIVSVLALGSIFLLQACFPFGPEDIEEFDIVATFFDENTSFNAYKTYAMPDSIAKIDRNGLPDTQGRTGEYDALILSQIAANMGALGYERIENPDEADMLMTLAISLDGYELGGGYDYGDYYGPGYDYGTGNYAGGSGYDLETGTVIINLAALNPAAQTETKAIWLGLINGITEQSYTNTSRRLITLINQCFSQSPYLGTSN